MSAAPTATGAAYSCVLFDLDGTITDSAAGITASLRAAFHDHGIPVPPPALLQRYVGPPLLDSLRDFAGLDARRSRRVLTTFREYYDSTVALKALPFPGVPDLLHELASASVPLALATGKPRTTARRILRHLELKDLFLTICGASDDETISEKADIVALALDALADRAIDLSRPVMVGDRGYDISGAAANEVPTIFVEWGYGSDAEAHDAIAVARTVDELRRMLLPA